MNTDHISLETLDDHNFSAVQAIRREDISEDFVDTASTLMELTHYGFLHHCAGRTFAIKYGRAYIGLILIGEALPWETDPPEMREMPFYRLMGFVLDRRCRGRGLGGYVLELAVQNIYEEFGVRPLALGCHKDNHQAARFYRKHGFFPTDAMEGNDVYWLRYPGNSQKSSKQQ